MRAYALNERAACSSAPGRTAGARDIPFPYFGEVMTGIEYQAAAHMIYEGLVEEGLR